LRAHCKANLSSFKVPKRFHIVADLPRTATGKVRKIELRSMFALTESGRRTRMA
jgi:acyl-coenzyme A synthetase/AMP-(fatty) acid ligase